MTIADIQLCRCRPTDFLCADNGALFERFNAGNNTIILTDGICFDIQSSYGVDSSWPISQTEKLSDLRKFQSTIAPEEVVNAMILKTCNQL
jgi:hypothetical protein